MAVTTWNTAPDYDQWGIDTSWSCEDWIQWHRLLLPKFGKDKAKIIWDYAYAKSGSLSSNLDCRTFNSSFRKYVSENNLDPYANAGIFSPVLGTYGSVTDIGGNLLKGITSFTQGNTVKNILNIALVGAVVIGGIYAYKTFKK